MSGIRTSTIPFPSSLKSSMVSFVIAILTISGEIKHFGVILFDNVDVDRRNMFLSGMSHDILLNGEMRLGNLATTRRKGRDNIVCLFLFFCQRMESDRIDYRKFIRNAPSLA